VTRQHKGPFLLAQSCWWVPRPPAKPVLAARTNRFWPSVDYTKRINHPIKNETYNNMEVSPQSNLINFISTKSDGADEDRLLFLRKRIKHKFFNKEIIFSHILTFRKNVSFMTKYPTAAAAAVILLVSFVPCLKITVLAILSIHISI
jgi:hypothetical protein